MTFGRSITEWREKREAERARNLAALCKPSNSIHKGTYTATSATSPIPKDPEPTRDESYRRWVASLPCYECGIRGYSNAAHPNSGKAKGRKADDRLCFPLCCARWGEPGCHYRFDQYQLVSRDLMPAYEAAALEWTRQQEGCPV